MIYKTKSTANQFAVFSEIYYPKGWNAYLDEKPIAYPAVNYVLRGLEVPAGEHTIKFVFEPDSFKKGTAIMYASSFIILLVVLGGFAISLRNQYRK
jgi:uncharacterized membrane protein YfhO